MPANLAPLEIDPVSLHEDLDERLQRYLRTALPVNERFPLLRAEIDRELAKPGSLVQGPYLEALPDFPKGVSLATLVEQGILHQGFCKLDEPPGSSSNAYRRLLHKHQEIAIRAVVEGDSNTIVATGTGSGKTECFLMLIPLTPVVSFSRSPRQFSWWPAPAKSGTRPWESCAG